MNIKSAGDSFGRMLTLGTVLYRDVPFCRASRPMPEFKQPIQAVLPEMKPPVKGDRGNNMFRINISGSFGWSPVVFVPEIYNRGIVLFVNEEIPDNWTHLIVSGNSFRKVEKDDGSFIYTGAVFAKCPKPYDMDAYLEFRTQMGNRYSENVTHGSSRALTWHEKMKIIQTVRPPENRSEEKHLFCDELGTSGAWSYDHITWGSSSETTKKTQTSAV